MTISVLSMNEVTSVESLMQNTEEKWSFYFFGITLRIMHFDPRGRPQSLPVVITIFTQIVRPSVRPKTSISFINHCRSVFELAEGIIDDSCLVVYNFHPAVLLTSEKMTCGRFAVKKNLFHLLKRVSTCPV